MLSDPFDALRVSLLPKIGGYRGRNLLQTMGSYSALRAARIKELMRVDGFNAVLSQAVYLSLRDERLQREIETIVARNMATAMREGVEFCSFFDGSFPGILRKIYDPPLFLFRKGGMTADDERALAMVGTRSPTEYGKQAAFRFASACAGAGITVVSGLAFGIDTIVHHTTLQEGGRTIAVLGSGIGNVYPYANRRLAERICEHGCLLSELPLDAKPDAQNFPRRNRIISGLASGTVVVESGAKGGAIITAELAMDQNREVFAVPGSIFNPKSEGTNDLIRRGFAHALCAFDDIYEHLPLLRSGEARRAPSTVQLSLLEESIMGILSDTPQHIDEVALSAGLATADALVQLLQLEFKGAVRQLPGKHFVRDL